MVWVAIIHLWREEHKTKNEHLQDILVVWLIILCAKVGEVERSWHPEFLIVNAVDIDLGEDLIALHDMGWISRICTHSRRL